MHIGPSLSVANELIGCERNGRRRETAADQSRFSVRVDTILRFVTACGLRAWVGMSHKTGRRANSPRNWRGVERTIREQRKHRPRNRFAGGVAGFAGDRCDCDHRGRSSDDADCARIHHHESDRPHGRVGMLGSARQRLGSRWRTLGGTADRVRGSTSSPAGAC